MRMLSQLVMVNFMCQLDQFMQPEMHRLSIISRCLAVLYPDEISIASGKQ